VSLTLKIIGTGIALFEIFFQGLAVSTISDSKTMEHYLSDTLIC
jgi:hypothetical protein